MKYVLSLLRSSLDSHIFLFHTLMYINFGQKRHSNFDSCATYGRTDKPTDKPSHRDARTHLKIRQFILTASSLGVLNSGAHFGGGGGSGGRDGGLGGVTEHRAPLVVVVGTLLRRK